MLYVYNIDVFIQQLIHRLIQGIAAICAQLDPSGWNHDASTLSSFITQSSLSPRLCLVTQRRNQWFDYKRKNLYWTRCHFVFDYSVSPLRHIPDVFFRYYVLLMLGLIRKVSFSVAIGSYSFMAASILGQFFIAAAAVTGATFTVVAK